MQIMTWEKAILNTIKNYIYHSREKSIKKMIFSIFIYKSKNAIIFSGSANKQLSEEIARYLGTKLGKI